MTKMFLPDGKTEWAGVLGWPVSHSLSPAIHNSWLTEHNINAVYLPLPVRPEGLKTVIAALIETGCVGINVTIPHKEVVIPLLYELHPDAKRIGAVNTIVFNEGKPIGYNTDAYGFWKGIENRLPEERRNKAVVLGAGGAARAVVVALIDAGFKEIVITNRTADKAQNLVQLGKQIKIGAWEERALFLAGADLLVNTTSLGMKGQDALILSLEKLPITAVVCDIVYKPLITPLLAEAQKRGNPIVDGLNMLLFQAQKSFHLWFDINPVVDETLRRKLLSLLEAV